MLQRWKPHEITYRDLDGSIPEPEANAPGDANPIP